MTKILKDQIISAIQGAYDVVDIVKDIDCDNKRSIILGFVALASDNVCFYLLGTDFISAGSLGVSIFYCRSNIACKDRLGALFGCRN